MNVFPLLLG
jgi:hypothetical protein